MNSSFTLPQQTVATEMSSIQGRLPQAAFLRDTSLNNATNEINRRWAKYIKIENELANIKSSQSDIMKKQQIIQKLQQNPLSTLKLTQKDIFNKSSDELEAEYYRHYLNQKQNEAAIKIQRFYRMHLDRQNFKQKLELRLSAKSMILQAWKKSRWTRLLKQMTNQKKSEAATKVQQYLKGHQARENVWRELKEKRLQQGSAYFERKRNEIYTDSQVKISYHWRRHKKQEERERKKLLLSKIKSREDEDKNRKSFKKGRGVFYEGKSGPAWGYSKVTNKLASQSQSQNIQVLNFNQSK
eukprot:403351364